MATIYTEYQNVDHFFAYVDSGGPNFNGFEEAVFDPMDQFLGSTRTFGANVGIFDQTANHRTGNVNHGGPAEGTFVIVGSNLGGLPTSSMTVNAVVLEPLSGGTFLMTSTGGATLVQNSDNITGGSINHLFFETGTPGVDGHFLYDLNGALSFSAHTLTVSSIHIEQTFDSGGLVTVSGTLRGSFTFGEGPEETTVIKSGTITALSLDIDGDRFEASGFSVSAVTFFNAETSEAVGALLALIGAGNDVVTGGGAMGQVLNGYAGNDVLIAGADSTTFIGGTGNDIFDFNGYSGHTVTEDAGVAGGIDTVRTTNAFSLQDAQNVERLVLMGDSSVNGTGNELVNVIIGNSGSNWIDGMESADSMVGGGGDDYFYVDNALDKLGTEAADDSLDTVYSTVNHVLGANFEILYLDGGVTGTGNALNNIISGNGAANVLAGMGGADSITGGSGNDKIDGGDGNDMLLGESGANTILGGGGDDTITGGNDNSTDSDVIDAGAGNDNVDGGEGADSLSGGAGADSIYGSSENDLINGGDGNDMLFGDSGDNTIFGGGGDDVITSDFNNDVVDGGAGIDTHVVNAGEGTITLGATTENLIFTHATVSSEGIGNALANTFTSGGALDHFDGKGGNDTYHVNSTGDTASEDSSGGGIDLVITDSWTNYTLGAGIENLTMNFSEGNSGTGNGLNNVMTHGTTGSAITFNGLLGNDTYNAFFNTIVNEDSSGGGNDLVVATLQDEQQFSLGNDIERLTLLHVGEGHITGYGNTGNNVITGANNADNFLWGGNGNDDADSLIGGAGSDTLWGQNGADSLVGGAGNDVLDGDAGSDTMAGGAGDDAYWRDLLASGGTITPDGDVITELAAGGTDTVYFNSGADDTQGGTFTLALAGTYANVENLDGSIAGNNIKFNFTGNAGNNMLVGGDMADTLNGGTGNDWLDGGAGNDQLIGGAGDDSYVLSLLNGGGGNAFITNLGEVNDSGGTGDVMVLTGGAGNSATFSYTIGADTSSPFEGVDASGASTALYFNLTGNALGNRLIGGLAADTAGGGHDTLTGGLGNDTYGVNAGDTVDEVTGGGGNADLVIAYLTNGGQWSLGGGIENLTLVAINNATVLNGNGNELANRITGDSHAGSNLYGGEGVADKDTLIGGAGDDSLDGGNGADSLIGGLGNDTYLMNFGTTSGAVAALPDMYLDTGGIDSLVLANGNGVTVTLTLGATMENLDASYLSASVGGTQKLTGNVLDNRIIASHGINSVVGGAGNDTLEGGGDGSTSTLDGGVGDDLYVESSGNDTFLFSQAGDTIEVGENGGIDSVIVSVAGGHEVLDLSEFYSFIDNARFTGTGSVAIIGNGSDNILTGNAGADTIRGGSFDDGNGDVLDGAAGNDLLDGGEGADTMTGGAGDDSMQGGYAQTPGTGWSDGGDLMTGNAGNDTLDGGEGGADTLSGGDGNDELYGGADNGGAGLSNDILNGDAGNDTLDGGQGDDQLAGGVGNDSLYGNEGADTLTGGDGADTIIGGNGADSMLGGAGNDVFDNPSMSGGVDTMVGGAGDDSYTVNDTNDVVTELAAGGTDTVFSDASSFTLGANIERLTIRYGSDGTGNSGANVITGSASGNILAGGGGNDTVTGGGGSDYFLLAHTAAGNVMAIQDFDQAEDLLMLDGGTFGGLLGPVPPDVVTNGLVATANHAQFIYTYGTGASLGSLYYDADGTGAGAKVLVATFAAGTKPVELTSSDFTGPV